MTFLALGTFWFWIIVVLGFALITFWVENSNSSGFWAFMTSAIVLTVLFFFGSREPLQKAFSYAIDNPMIVIAMVLGYFIVGTAWSIVKWYFHLKWLQREDKWPREQVLTNPDFDRKKGEQPEYKNVQLAPKAKDYRSDILLWMSWWPFSALWTLINDPVRQAFEWIFDWAEKTFDRISQRVFDGATKS